MITQKVTNIDTTEKVTDLANSRIPVGKENGTWEHITPQDLATGILQQVTEQFTEGLTETIQQVVIQEIQNQGGIPGGGEGGSGSAIDMAPILIPVSSKTLVVDLSSISVPTTYQCGTLRSLKITNLQTNLYETTILFNTDDTPTELIMPSGYKSLGNIVISKNRAYVLSILNGIVACKVLSEH